MNQVANLNETADFFAQYANAATRRSIVGKLLKFSKGDYTAGEHNEEVPDGTRMVANMDSLVIGWQKWANNKPVEQIMGLLAEGFQPPKRRDLDDNDDHGWEVDENGRPRDPWQSTNQLLLKMQGGDEGLYTFATSSNGGLTAIGELCGIYGKASRVRPGEFPIISLEVRSYTHAIKAYGRIKTPAFDVVGWASKAEFEDTTKAITKF